MPEKEQRDEEDERGEGKCGPQLPHGGFADAYFRISEFQEHADRAR